MPEPTDPVGAPRWRSALHAVAIAWLLGTVLFVAVNAAAAVALRLDRSQNPVLRRFGAAIYDAYPGWSRPDVNRLLNETWPRWNFQYDVYAQFKERPRSGRYVNVASAGYRHSTAQGPWPIDPHAYNVFVFGGSRAFGYGIADDSTIASQLVPLLRPLAEPREPRVYNFGRGFFYLGQERVLFERLLSEGHVPNLAIFVDGGNDLSVYRRFEGPRFTRTFDALSRSLGNPPLFSVSLPLTQWLRRPPAPDPDDQDAAGSGAEWRLPVSAGIQHYVTSKRMAEAAAAAFAVPVLFAWHPIATYKYDISYHPLRAILRQNANLAYKEMAEYVAGHDLGNDFLWLADIQEDVRKNLYVDRAHYNPEGCSLVARHIAEALATRRYFARSETGARSGH